MGGDALSKVDWTLPGMEKFTEHMKRHITRCIEQEDIVNSIHSLGWALWPTTNRGYYDETLLRSIADFIEIQNKPFWDHYNAHCLKEVEMERSTLEEVKYVHDKYKALWMSGEYNSQDDVFVDLFNELEDIFNPNRISGN